MSADVTSYNAFASADEVRALEIFRMFTAYFGLPWFPEIALAVLRAFKDVIAAGRKQQKRKSRKRKAWVGTKRV
jgi:hypothetical protein